MNITQVIENIRQVASRVLPKGSTLYLHDSRAHGDYHKDSNWIFLLLFLTVLYSSCATIISGTSAKIQIDGNVDEPVNIVISQADSLYRVDSLRWAEAEREVVEQLQARQLPKRYKRHELRGGLGFGECQASHDRDKMVNGFKERYGLEGKGGIEDFRGDAYLQAGFEYHYRLNKKWEIGLLVNWGTSQEAYSRDYDPYGNVYNPPSTEVYKPCQFAGATETCRFFTFAPSVRYTWYETIGFRSYSRIAVGAMRHHLIFDYKRFPWVEDYEALRNIIETQTPLYTDGSDDIKWRMAYQLTAIGASVGGKSFNFFGELGYGSLGIVRLGIGFMF